MTWHYLSMGPSLAFIAAKAWAIGAAVFALIALAIMASWVVDCVRRDERHD